MREVTLPPKDYDFFVPWVCLVQSGVPLAKKSLSDSGSVYIFRIETGLIDGMATPELQLAFSSYLSGSGKCSLVSSVVFINLRSVTMFSQSDSKLDFVVA
ncbi:hypothetical protein OIU85_006433 [Salix viminalis]|uniref:Uncharacterized protein n=1 Tax=Salix viminalis TaxID=40686 RepID=A0A9Q0SUG6_SALVM|nr:hypothetical protein OIU85_006433 [Salix viminalis]